MTDRPQLLAGLLARRAETATAISNLEIQLRTQQETLRCLDHLIRVEDPDAELPGPRKPRVKAAGTTDNGLVRGDLTRGALDVLREAGGATLESRQVAEQIAKRRGITFATKRQHQHFASSVTMALNRLGRRGIVERVGIGPNRIGRWRVLSRTRT